MTRTFPALVFAAAALAGCAQSNKSIAISNGELRDIRGNEVTAELKLDALDSSGPLNQMHREAVAMFGGAFEQEGHGPLIISSPNRSAGEQGARASTEIRALLLAEGVSDDRIVQSGYDAAGAVDAPIILTYRTYEAAISTACPDLSAVDFSNTKTNGPLASFGCAVNGNLAAQIANPSDVVRMADSDPADAGRRMVVFSKYRNGEKTGAVRDTNANATISQAVSE